jgi:Domain of unknown function (DUF6431)
MSEVRQNQNRTAIIYFGPQQEDYLKLMEAQNRSALIEYIQRPLEEQLVSEKHKEGCCDTSRYTIHGMRERQVEGWMGETHVIPICRVRCQSCRAVFTVLPSFLMRYRRQDTDCLEKLMEMNLGMGLSQRETATIYAWNQAGREWQPGWIWRLVQWLGGLMPVALLLMQLGLFPPEHLLSDEKFATLAGEEVYLFLISQEELIWYGEWLERTSQESFDAAIGRCLETMDSAATAAHLLEANEQYDPVSVTTDGWKPVQSAWEAQVPDITLIECNLHGRKRVDATLEDYAKAHPELSDAERKAIKTDFEEIFAAPTLSAFSQRIRRATERYAEEPILLNRLAILKDKRFLFTNHLKFESAPAFSSALDRSMRFLDEKLISFGQFRAPDRIDPMLNAWAIVNNLRSFLPGAKKAGQSLAEHFGAKLKGIPWMEALNLCTVGALSRLVPVPSA